MQIVEVSGQEYGEVAKTGFFYDSIIFNELNKDKVDELKFLIFKDSKSCLGLILGIKDRVVKCPFSAPFSMFSHIKDRVSVKQFDEAVQALDNYMAPLFAEARFVLPPIFYAPGDISCVMNAFCRVGFSIETIDLNFQIDLSGFNQEQYIDILYYNAKKNFAQSYKSGLTFEECRSDEEIMEAYRVIAENRFSKGYPLRMTYEQLSDTLKIVGHFVFVVRQGKTAIASAILYRLNEEIAQVIYWGDSPGYSECRPMNFLSYNVVMYCKKIGLHWLDIGPSTENGIPNYGLCDFKQGIGCGISAKLSLMKKY